METEDRGQLPRYKQTIIGGRVKAGAWELRADCDVGTAELESIIYLLRSQQSVLAED